MIFFLVFQFNIPRPNLVSDNPIFPNVSTCIKITWIVDIIRKLKEDESIQMHSWIKEIARKGYSIGTNILMSVRVKHNCTVWCSFHLFECVWILYVIIVLIHTFVNQVIKVYIKIVLDFVTKVLCQQVSCNL